MAVLHDVQSNAHEDSIPGTVDLNAGEGDETGYGQALFPVPSADPNDPLQWPSWKKHTILVICVLYSFLGCAAVFGVSPYITLFAETFTVSINDAAGLINFPSLAYGFSSLALVPLYHKIGRRPVMLISMVMYAAGLLGSSQARTYSGLMGARIVQAFGSGVCEALPVQLVNDIFFLHERGSKLGYYVTSLSMGAVGPLYASYMLAAGYSWRLFFYVNFGLSIALLVATFFLVEESRFVRKSIPSESQQSSLSHDKKAADTTITELAPIIYCERKSLTAQLALWSYVDYEYPYFKTIGRSFTYLLVPSNLWVITTYGLFIGVCGLAYNYTFPIKITSPPYNWPVTRSGMLAVATIIGYALALPFSSSSDRLAAYLTKRNNMVREAEMRLGVLLPAVFLAPAGLLLFGISAEKNFPWYLYFVAVAIVSWAAYFFFTFTLAYAMDSYNANLSEIIIIQNLCKTAIGFGAGYKVLDWVLENGYGKVIGGWFSGILLLNNLFVIVFMIWGKKFRILIAGSWLAKLHARTVVAGETH